MNPDKLFDYLDGRLPAGERAALERQLISDPQLQRELAVAREIHARMRADSREVFLPTKTDVTERGRKMALRVGATFIILMVVNVAFGIWLIARHESKNPNRALLEKQMRQQISKALEHAATALTPAPLGVSEVTVPAAAGKLEEVSDKIVGVAAQFGGSATKGLADQQHRLSVLVELPPNRESEFRTAIAAITGEKPELTTPEPVSSAFATATADKTAPATTTTPPITPQLRSTIPATAQKKSFVVHVVETTSKRD